MDSGDGRGSDIVGSLGRGVGGKRRRMTVRTQGPDESPIMPSSILCSYPWFTSSEEIQLSNTDGISVHTVI